jgi:hypothetical protein
MRVGESRSASSLRVRETLFLEPFWTKPEKDTFLLFLHQTNIMGIKYIIFYHINLLFSWPDSFFPIR